MSYSAKEIFNTEIKMPVSQPKCAHMKVHSFNGLYSEQETELI
jgi:hypothetical protein